jgi:hypothetical protein
MSLFDWLMACLGLISWTILVATTGYCIGQWSVRRAFNPDEDLIPIDLPMSSEAQKKFTQEETRKITKR